MNSIQSCGMTNYPAVNCRNVNFRASLRPSVYDSLYSQIRTENVLDPKTAKGFLNRLVRNLKKIAPGVEITDFLPAGQKGHQIVRMQKDGSNMGIVVPGKTPMDALENLIKRSPGEGPNLAVLTNRFFKI